MSGCNIVTEKLYKKFPDVDALAAASPEEMWRSYRPCGLGRSKARYKRLYADLKRAI